MLGFARNLNLKPVPGNGWSMGEIKCILGMIEKADSTQLTQRWGSRSGQREESDLSGPEVWADWIYYNPYSRKEVAARR